VAHERATAALSETEFGSEQMTDTNTDRDISPPDTPLTPPAILTGAGIGIFFSLGVLVWALVYRAWWQDFQMTPDALEYAEIARNVVRGHGFVCGNIWPLDLTVGRPPYEYPVHRSPLACLYLVPSVMVWGTDPMGVLFPSLVLYAGLVAATWWIGARLFGPWAGLCATTLLLANYNVLLHALTGYPTMLFSVLVAGLLVGAAVAKSRLTVVVLLGLVLGIAYMVRTNALAIGASASAVLLFDKRFGPRRVGLLVAVALLAVLPYLVANVLNTGSALANSRKYILLFNTQAFPGYSIHGYVDPPEPLGFFWNHPDELVRKVWHGLFNFARSMWTAGRGLGLVFGLVGLMGACAADTTRRLRKLLVAAVIAQGITDCLTVSESRFLVPLVPVLYLFAGWGLAECVRRSWRKQALWAVLLVSGVLGISLSGWLGFPRVLATEFGAKPHRVVANAVQQIVGDSDQLVASDLATAVCWYAHRRAFHLPRSPRELLKAQAYLGPVDWVVIARKPARDRWRKALRVEPRLAQRFEHVRTIRDGARAVADVYRVRDVP